LLSTFSLLSAKDIAGTLSQGDGSSFTPEQGAAFSIVLDVAGGFYRGKYDILIRVNDNTIYNRKDQSDDIYLVFNDPVSSDDIIKIDVTHGQFKFKMNGIDKLPKVIVDAIKMQLPQKPSVDLTEKDSNENGSIDNINKDKPTDQDKKSIGFFDALSKKLSSVFKTEKIESEKLEDSIKKETKSDLVEIPSLTKKGVDISSSGIDEIEKQRVPTNLPSTINSIDELSTQKLELPDIKKSGVDINNISQQSIDNEASFNSQTSTPNFDSNIQSAKNILPRFNIKQREKFKTEIEENEKPFFKTKPKPISQIEKTFKKDSRPKFSSSVESIPDIQSFDDKKIVKELQTEFDQSELAEVKDIEDISPMKLDIPTKPMIIEDDNQRQRIVITKTLTPKQKAKKAEEAKENSRVIKRHITPDEYKREQEVQKIPSRMADRIQGGGYMGISKGKVRVSAYSNNRPVSAWIEVFRAGTKQRVKTFYTGKGRNLRDIKLPAGVYVIKATYRTSGMKKQKTLGRVVLGEGESLSKSISFDDGKIKIIATRLDRPLYAKVEIFKKGTQRRIMYEFTSRSSGEVMLNVPTGRYDIVVNDHSNVLRFDNVRVRAGKTRTFNADF
jgi:hypothetical protein